ncbi:hypothetical protein JW979_13720 [bacterium]|nr:hypothetical protein [candidate division CSSED10-310 bacterium]
MTQSNVTFSKRIAVPSNDGTTIYRGMLGRAKMIYIYDVDESGNVRFLEERSNPHSETMQHLKTLDVYDLLKDCSIIISGKIGKKGIERLQNRGMELIFRQGTIQDALRIFKKE